MRRKRLVFGLIGICALALLGACGDGGEEGTGPGEARLTAPQSTAIANQIVSAVLRAFRSLPGANAAPSGAALHAIPVNLPIDSTVACTDGGQIRVAGSVSGQLDDSFSGTLNLSASASLSSCTVSAENTRIVLNGSLSVAGQVSVVNAQPADQQTVTVSGAVEYDATPGGSGTCQIQLTMTVSIATRSGTATGTVCGNQVTASGSA